MYPKLMYLSLTEPSYDRNRIGLTELVRLTGIKPKHTRKAEYLNILENFYKSPNQLRDVWKVMSPYERDCAADIIRHGGYLFEERIEEIAKKHQVTPEIIKNNFNRSTNLNKYVTSKNRALLFLVEDVITQTVIDTLTPYMTPEVFKQPIEVPSKDLQGYSCYETTATLQRDLATFIKTVGTSKLKVNKTTCYPTKASIKKINAVLEGQEYTTENYSIDIVRKAEHIERIGGLYDILVELEIFQILGETNLALDDEANKFLQLPFKEQAKRLYQGYLNLRWTEEVEHIRGEKFKLGYATDLEAIRKCVLNMLAYYPVGQWCLVDDISEQMYALDRSFVKRHTDKILTESEYGRYLEPYRGGWEPFERRMIETMLLRYLAPIGLVDITIEDEEVVKGHAWQETTIDYIRPIYFRVTPLGAYLLGKVDNYVDESMAKLQMNHLVVDNQLRVILEPSQRRLEHEIFLERLAVRQEEGDNLIYTVDFQMALKALEEDISLEDILKYLEKAATAPLPHVVHQVFDKWEKDRSKIRIRTLTVIECDDPEIQHILREYQGVQKHLIRDYTDLLEIDPTSAVKIKKELEKNHHFCQLQEAKQ